MGTVDRGALDAALAPRAAHAAYAPGHVQHHAAPRGQTTARSGGGARVEVHGRVPEDAPPPPPPQAAVPSTLRWTPGRTRGRHQRRAAPPLREVRPQAGAGRHGGIGYELVLSTTVPRVMEDEAWDPGVLIFLRAMKEGTDEKEEEGDGEEGSRRVGPR